MQGKDILAELETMPVGRFHYKLLLAAGLGWAFDSMDTGLIAFLMPKLAQEWQLSAGAIGLLGSIGLIGMAIGAILAGALADHWGRKRVFAAMVILYSLASALCALAPSYTWLVCFRFLVGLGLGGELPVAATLVTEYIPTRVRGRFVVLLESFWAVGWLLAAGLTYGIALDFGWRVAFLIGALPAIYVGLIRMHLPESVRFLLSKGKIDEAQAIICSIEESVGRGLNKKVLLREMEKLVVRNEYEATKGDKNGRMDEGNSVAIEAVNPIGQSRIKDDVRNGKERELVNKGRAEVKQKISVMGLWTKAFRQSTLMLWITWFGLMFSYYGIFMWLPQLVYQHGFSMTKSVAYVLVMTLAQLPGYGAAAYLVEHWGRKYTFVIFLLASGLAAWFFGGADSLSSLLLWGTLMSFFNLGAWGVIYAYTPELYPTYIRGLGSGWAAGLGRLGGMAAPLLVGFLLSQAWMVSQIFLLFAFVFLMAAAAVLFLGTETKGKRLD